jgi:hypothetical protein
LRCRNSQDEFAQRRGTSLFNTKPSEAKAINIVDHLDEGGSIRATSRLSKVAKERVARLLKGSGRYAQHFHDQEVPDLTPRALAFDEQGSLVKKNRNTAPRTITMKRVTFGITTTY